MGLPPVRALPVCHLAQSMFQSPKPLPKGSIRFPSELTTWTRSPSRTVSKNHSALAVLIPTQPWLTLAEPCEPTDQGAACTYSPLQVTRVAKWTGRS